LYKLLAKKPIAIEHDFFAVEQETAEQSIDCLIFDYETNLETAKALSTALFFYHSYYILFWLANCNKGYS